MTGSREVWAWSPSWPGDAHAGRGVRAFSRNGVLGDPEGASAREGERRLDDAVAGLDRWLG